MNLPLRERIAREVVGVIIDALNSGDLPLEKAKAAAGETLTTLDKIEKHEETVAEFYKSLAKKYPVFNVLYTKIISDMAKSKEMSAYKEALAAIESGDVKGAHQIASSAISQSAHETTNAE